MRSKILYKTVDRVILDWNNWSISFWLKRGFWRTGFYSRNWIAFGPIEVMRHQ
jgi:hypothetical protein